MISGLASHLCQSTLFGGAAWVMVLALRRNQAHLRYWIWFIASAKFLLPFSLLVGIGTLMPLRVVTWPTQGWVATAEEISQPFTTLPAAAVRFASTTRGPVRSYFQTGALALWVCGLAAISVFWIARWMRVLALRRRATLVNIPTNVECTVPVMSAPGLVEPGIFGIFRPALLLPEGIDQRLDRAQLDAILVHELCHVRRHDNLTATIHMAAQAIFWFHPLVWWLGARLLDERERACDEEVLRLGSEPRVYAEGILNVCRLYVESPIACVSGVTGSNLKKRIEAIMENPMAVRLNFAKKLALAVAGTVTLAMPIVVGVLSVPAIGAQSSPSPPSARPKFEVASIKRCSAADLASADMARSGGRGGTGVLGDPGMFRTPCVTVRALIEGAYIRYADGQGRPLSMLKKQPLQGAPDWIDSDRYTVDAKPEAPQTRAMMGGPMLQALLEDRFKLKIHRITKEVPVYTLVVARGGAKLQATKEGGCTPGDPNGPPPPIVPGQALPCGYIDGDKDGVKAVGVSIESLCTILSHQFRRDVIDKTGLTGLFDYQLDIVMGPPGTAPAEDDPNALDVVTVGLQKLGLKLEQSKGTAEVVVIDHVERPSGN